MPRYVAFLRGINISGRHKIGMSDLKNGFEFRRITVEER